MQCGKCGNNMSPKTQDGVSFIWCWCCGNRVYPSYPAREGKDGENRKGVVLSRDKKGGDERDRKGHSNGSTKVEDYQASRESGNQGEKVLEDIFRENDVAGTYQKNAVNVIERVKKCNS